MEYFSVEEIVQNERTDICFITQIVQNDREEVSVQTEEEVSVQAKVDVPEPKQVVQAGPSLEDVQNGNANGTDADDDFSDINWDADHLDITKYLIKIMDRPDNLIVRQQVRPGH
jgi:pullulanase/glycogen debranching enzyme